MSMLIIANYISLPWVTKVLSCCLEAVGVWMEENRFQLNPGKIEWLWVSRPLGFGDFLSLTLFGSSLSQSAGRRIIATCFIADNFQLYIKQL